MEKSENEEELKAKARRLSVWEGVSYSFMDGFGLRYITPFFSDYLKASNSIIGLLGSMPSLMGNTAQLSTIKLMRKYSRKSIVFVSVLTQSLFWLPLILLGYLLFIGKISPLKASIVALIAYSLLITVGAIGGPAWSSWMGDITDKGRGNYFGRRDRIISSFALGGMLIAGYILKLFSGKNVFFGFALIFFIAFLGRLVSAMLFRKLYEPKYEYKDEFYFTIFQFIKKMPYNNFGRFSISIMTMSFAVSIASPFFGVYLLRNLGFGGSRILIYTIVSMVSIVVSLLTLPLWGKFIDKNGSVRVIRLTAIMVSFVPLYYATTIFFKSYSLTLLIVYMVLVESFSGFFWAGYNLSTGLFVYDAVTKQRLPICVSYNSMLAAIAGFLGASLGSFIARSEIVFGINSLIFLFLLSGLLRFSAAILARRMYHEVRPVEKTRIISKIYSEIRHLRDMGIKRLGFSNFVHQQPEV